MPKKCPSRKCTPKTYRNWWLKRWVYPPSTWLTPRPIKNIAKNITPLLKIPRTNNMASCFHPPKNIPQIYSVVDSKKISPPLLVTKKILIQNNQIYLKNPLKKKYWISSQKSGYFRFDLTTFFWKIARVVPSLNLDFFLPPNLKAFKRCFSILTTTFTRMKLSQPWQIWFGIWWIFNVCWKPLLLRYKYLRARDPNFCLSSGINKNIQNIWRNVFIYVFPCSYSSVSETPDSTLSSLTSSFKFLILISTRNFWIFDSSFGSTKTNFLPK